MLSDIKLTNKLLNHHAIKYDIIAKKHSIRHINAIDSKFINSWLRMFSKKQILWNLDQKRYLCSSRKADTLTYRPGHWQKESV